jgi:hypothetical protein
VPHSPHLSLTSVINSAPTWRAAISAHGLAVLTRHTTPELRVVATDIFLQLLVAADESVRLGLPPNLKLLSKTLAAGELVRILSVHKTQSRSCVDMPETDWEVFDSQGQLNTHFTRVLTGFLH